MFVASDDVLATVRAGKSDEIRIVIISNPMLFSRWVRHQVDQCADHVEIRIGEFQRDPSAQPYSGCQRFSQLIKDLATHDQLELRPRHPPLDEFVRRSLANCSRDPNIGVDNDLHLKGSQRLRRR